jgi:hypothetical protein
MRPAVAFLLLACVAGAVPASADPVPVEVVQQGERFVLLRGGEPYVIEGAGIGGADERAMDKLAAHGGNSFRTWSTADGQRVLDAAERHGLTVALCLDLARERHGFDYDDEAAVRAQLERFREEVLKYKDHPALLAWIIGNEPNLEFTNPKVFDAIDEISRMIHALDGRHPTTTALAGFDAELARLVEERSPDLDFISIQFYGGLLGLPRILEETGYDGPYVVSEWGAIGWWEVERTAWGAPLEQDSSAKAQSYRTAWETVLASDRTRLLGSYVFLWGQKQERTPTWFGMFLADGTATEVVDFMHYAWNGEWPDNRTPRIEGAWLDGRTATEGVALTAGEIVEARVAASDPDGDALEYRWEVLRETTATTTGGDPEPVPEAMPGLIEPAGGPRVRLRAPDAPGAFRLYVYVYDGAGHAGHANIPFLVRE